ncbi:MAG: hypothetical protein QXW39_06230 [Candidatus Bathyarchaeia archaeon]
MVIGKRGQGKTEMMRTFAKEFSDKAHYTTMFTYGGIGKVKMMKARGINTILYADLQSLTKSREAVRNNAIKAISALVEEGMQGEIVLDREDSSVDANLKMNFVIAGRFPHITFLDRVQADDLLDRFVYILFPDREVDQTKPYTLSIKPVHINKRLEAKFNNRMKDFVNYKNMSPRHSKLLNELLWGLKALGFNETYQYVLEHPKEIMFYDKPEEGNDKVYRYMFNSIIKPAEVVLDETVDNKQEQQAPAC